ncbi:MAG: hypothetical protein KC475_00340 [Cyanobacteria bacterium HKST-UBA03]|nr:hypothetical protein [Cyanobacteria bacterium HKST-UBA03]
MLDITNSEPIKTQAAIDDFIQYLAEQGKHCKTVTAYSSDLAVVLLCFEPDALIEQFTLSRIGKFLKSDTLLYKRTGQPRSIVGQERIVRVFRQFLIWCEQQKYFERAPVPNAMLVYKAALLSDRDGTTS